MSPIIHGMMAWIIATLLLKDLRDRRLVIIAGVIPDIDAILLLVNVDLFFKYHHTIGHSFVFAIPLVICFSLVAKDRVRVLVGGLVVFSLHIIADYFGSNWPISILYPISDYSITSAGYISYHMMYGVIDPIAAGVVLLIVFILIVKLERSPLEFISGPNDRRLVGLYINPIKYRCHRCPTLALFTCKSCEKKVCWEHMGPLKEWMCDECTLRNSKADKNV